MAHVILVKLVDDIGSLFGFKKNRRLYRDLISQLIRLLNRDKVTKIDDYLRFFSVFSYFFPGNRDLCIVSKKITD